MEILLPNNISVFFFYVSLVLLRDFATCLEVIIDNILRKISLALHC